MRKIIRIFDVPIDSLTMNEAIVKVQQFIKDGSPHSIITANAEMLMLTLRDPDLKSIMNQADMVTPDGAGVLWASKRIGQPIPEKVAGIDLVRNICRVASQKKYTMYFFGAKPDVAQSAAERLQREFPGLEIVGVTHGYFTLDEEQEILHKIRTANPDILLIGLGVPFQEKWLAKHKQQLAVPVCIGIGGSFDVLSGQLNRAPQWMIDSSLEWLYRLYLEPRRIGRMMALPKFMFRIIFRKND